MTEGRGSPALSLRQMSNRIAAEMYTVRDAADAGTLERIAAMGYLGVELVGLHGATPDRVSFRVSRLAARGRPRAGVPS